jgi:hypothetical protein
MNGTGLWVLSGTNTYSGGTAIKKTNSSKMAADQLARVARIDRCIQLLGRCCLDFRIGHQPDDCKSEGRSVT